MFLLLCLGIVLTFMPFVMLAGKHDEHVRRMAIRFAMLQLKNPEGLSSAAVDRVLRDSRQTKRVFGPRLERVCERLGLKELVEQSNTGGTASQWLLAALALPAIMTPLVWHFASTGWAMIPGGAVAAYLPIAFLKLRRKRWIRAMEASLPQAVDLLARALRAGHALSAAISIVAEQAPEPARTEFATIYHKQKFGLPLRDALGESLQRVPSQDLRVLVAAILIQRETGGNLTQVLDRTSTVIRERLKLQRDVRVHTAQGRLTGWILCALPLVLLCLMNLLNPGYSKVLFTDPVGRECLELGMVLMSIGAFLIHRIVSGIEV